MNRANTTVFELNKNGTNRWSALVQPGFRNDGTRTSEQELEAIAHKLSLVDDIFEALENTMGHLDTPIARRWLCIADDAEWLQEARSVVSKVKSL